MLHKLAENNILLLFSNLFEQIYLFSQINTWGKIKIGGNNSPNLLSFGDTKSGFSPVQFGKNYFALLHCSQWSTFSFLGSPWCFIYSIPSHNSTGSLLLQHFMKLRQEVVVVFINPNFVTAGFCDLGCNTKWSRWSPNSFE